ncbi:hypothetical protein VNO77_27760 [Canavalia gladiata]|uniref:Uncharacterized protein n=1 Tax=Canavalia gladiata TaxID=3824 RepID=A0AAN9Q6S9_CANGL
MLTLIQYEAVMRIMQNFNLSIRSAPLRALKWYERPVGVSFGFGGKFVSFHPRASVAGPSARALEVYVHNLVTEHGLELMGKTIQCFTVQACGETC